MMMKIKNRKSSCYLLIASIIFLIGALVALQKLNMDAAAQIESNSTFTTCINGKCVTTATTCIINQPCHTVRSNSTTASSNNYNSTKDNHNNNDDGVAIMPFSQGTI